jgi:hypothetical protein
MAPPRDNPLDALPERSTAEIAEEPHLETSLKNGAARFGMKDHTADQRRVDLDDAIEPEFQPANLRVRV